MTHEDDRAGAAERAHAAHAAAVAAAAAPLLRMGDDLLKAVAVLNGGAAVATLFLLARTIRTERALAAALVWPLATFGFGLTVALFATGWSYFAQSCEAAALRAQAPVPSPPFVVATPASAAAARRAELFRRLALGAVFVAMASAVGGFALAGAALLTNLR